MNTLLFLKIFLSIIMIFAAIPKLFSQNSFRNTIDKIINNKIFVPIAAFLVPTFEIMTSLFLLFDRLIEVGLIFLTGLLLSFTYAVWKTRNVSVTCNCFGSLSNENLGVGTIFKIIFLAILGIVIFILENNAVEFKVTLLFVLEAMFTSIGLIFSYLIASLLISSRYE